MEPLRTLITLLLVALVSGAAFVPATHSTTRVSKTAVSFGFLKQLGLEKPDWLPDFGGKKKDEESPAPAAETPAEQNAEEAVVDN